MIVPIAYIVLRMGATPKSALIVCLVITIFAQITRLLVLKHLEASFSLKHYLSKVIWPTLLVAMTSMIIPMTLKWFVNNSDNFLSSIIVGAGAIILPNVKIGNNVIIGAGAVIAKNIPDNSLVVGNPAKIIGTYEDYEKKVRNQFQNLPVWNVSFDNKTEQQKKEMIETLKNSGYGFDV
jgi:hypothetical protein